jgi:hypothetical protein
MKLLDHFKTFLDDNVDLNQSRIDQLAASIEAVKKAIKESDWKPKIIQFTPQGSWAHKTIIKPLPDKEYDADLMVFVESVDGWEAKDYINKLYSALEVNRTYKEKLQCYSHCVTIEYAGERRIDIAPVIRNRQFVGQDEVCNRISNKFEVSAPEAYTNWVVQKNSIAGGNDLRKVTRLLKYMRDIKKNFICPSFLLTTLLGYRILDVDKDSIAFADTPTALKTLLGRLDDWLQANLTLPEVRNPVLNSEIQSTCWNEEQYSNFRDKINLYRGWVDEAYDEVDRDESIGKWRRVFGDDFARGETKEAASRISESATENLADAGAIVVAGHFKDLVDWVKQSGIKVIPARLCHLPHIERPKWRSAKTNISIRVSTQLLTGHYGSVIRAVNSGEPLQPDYSLRFTASTSAGLPFSTNDYSVKWRVTNTDKTAYAAGALRGDYYNSDSSTPMSRVEDLSYRGVHFVEVFLIRKADNKLAGQSEPFYVVIE